MIYYIKVYTNLSPFIFNNEFIARFNFPILRLRSIDGDIPSINRGSCRFSINCSLWILRLHLIIVRSGLRRKQSIDL